LFTNIKLTNQNNSDLAFSGELRDELLNGEIFYSLKEAQVLVEMWREHYNKIRPHSSLGYEPPAPEAILPSIKMGIAMRQKLTQHVV
jgi:transposase InsO family protein